MQCTHCASLNIQVLVDLAEVEFSSGEVPKTAYYQHHASIRDLEQSGRSGCHLCGQIVRAFIECRSRSRECFASEDETLLDAVKKWKASSPIRISIGSGHLYLRDTIEDVQNFDELCITVGELGEVASYHSSFGDPQLPTVNLRLSSSLGKL